MQDVCRRLRGFGRCSDDGSSVAAAAAGFRIRVFHDTAEVMEDLWAEIDAAQREILVVTYIMKDDEVGRDTLARLTAAAKRGVRVRLLYDDAGNITGRTRLTSKLRAVEGAEVAVFRPFFPAWAGFVWSGFHFLESPVVRNHRKMVLIDGRVGYVGGLNIGNEYAGRKMTGLYPTAGKTFRDILVKIEAPKATATTVAVGRDGVAADAVPFFRDAIDETFRINRLTAADVRAERGRRLSTDSFADYLRRSEGLEPLPDTDAEANAAAYADPAPATAAPSTAVDGIPFQLLTANPWHRDSSVQRSVHAAATGCRRRLWLVTPYYCPPAALHEAIEGAARRGVDVRLLVGGVGTTDPPLMRYAQQPWLKEALAAGVRVYEYGNTGEVMHAKMMVADDDVCTVGSYNLDLLSDRILEANVALHSREATALAAQQFQYDSSRSVPLSLGDWETRQGSVSYRTATKVATGILLGARSVLGGDYDYATDA